MTTLSNTSRYTYKIGFLTGRSFSIQIDHTNIKNIGALKKAIHDYDPDIKTECFQLVTKSGYDKLKNDLNLDILGTNHLLLIPTFLQYSQCKCDINNYFEKHK